MIQKRGAVVATGRHFDRSGSTACTGDDGAANYRRLSRSHTDRTRPGYRSDVDPDLGQRLDSGLGPRRPPDRTEKRTCSDPSAVSVVGVCVSVKVGVSRRCCYCLLCAGASVVCYVCV